ncbi:hypothetical protein TWF694_006477 [Orbilia ellipsospora]|uniref:Initiator tRNA phosphoribosyl transferase n=1 Tax=Orbilia ellipsospora TaxID=2528407 RepID=A0AAV9XNM8_9PEZI
MSFFRRPSSNSDESDEDESSMSDSDSNNSDCQNSNLDQDEEQYEEQNEDISYLTDDIFQPLSVNAIANTIRKSDRLSISNRLHSINEDSAFVQSVADELNLPLVANERCGSWYVPPEKKAGSCYFKSTDGHFGCWSFSLRRLNLNLLGIIGKHKGCIIVDSTRRGKSIPDALSKTVPIWCAVMNAVLFPSINSRFEAPENAVSASEQAQIARLIDGFVAQLHTLKLETEKLVQFAGRPMKPIWVTRDSEINSSAFLKFKDEFHPIYLLSASRYLEEQLQPRGLGVNGHNFVYIQGAGDDHEGWAQGLLPITYWANQKKLLQTCESELPSFIGSIVRSHREDSSSGDASGPSVLSKVHGVLAICDFKTYNSLLDARTPILGAIVCTESSNLLEEDQSGLLSVPVYRTVVPSNKVGSKILRSKLPEMLGFAKTVLSPGASHPMVIVCQSGNDMAVGIALALITRLFDDQGHLISSSTTSSNPQIDKTIIRQRLSWIISDRMQANPSRATLQAVNLFLMGWA